MTARCAEHGLDGPVFLRIEGFDLHLALNDETQADRLHTTCGARAWQLAPEHGGEIEADQIVKRAAREVGLNQRCVDLAGIFHRLGDSGFCDCVEDNAADGRVFLDRFALAQSFLQVPADRLSLAIRVGCENEVWIIFESVGNGFDMLAAINADFPCHVEIVLSINRPVFGRQVAYVTIRGKHGVVGPQIFIDRFGLGRGFDNNYGHKLPLKFAGSVAAQNVASA